MPSSLGYSVSRKVWLQCADELEEALKLTKDYKPPKRKRAFKQEDVEIIESVLLRHLTPIGKIFGSWVRIKTKLAEALKPSQDVTESPMTPEQALEIVGRAYKNCKAYTNEEAVAWQTLKAHCIPAKDLKK